MPASATTRILARPFLCMLLGALVSAATPAGTGVASERLDAFALLPPDARAQLDAGRSEIAELRDAFAADGVRAAMAAVIRAAGTGPHPQATPPPAHHSGVGQLRPPLRRPVADLWAAVAEALRMVRDSGAGERPRDMAALWSQVEALHDPAAMHAVHPAGAPADALLPLAPRAGRLGGPESGGTAGEAAILIGTALDRALPALQGAQPRARAAEGCDLLDRLPYLCVGSEADNTYTANAALQVDLGGDDIYRNTAGGAPFVPPGSADPIPISVAVDLGGSDTYVAPTINVADVVGPVSLGQGAGIVGGVGILVDAGGTDAYGITAPDTGPPDHSSLALGQGASMSGGFGALLDLGGDDRYQMTATFGTDDAIALLGQGLSSGCFGGCSSGLLLDRGEGNDAYTMDGGAVEQTLEGEERSDRLVVGQGWGGVGAGILADDGGADAFTAVAHASRLGLDAIPESLYAAPAQVWGQGFGLLGVGMLLEGRGPTTYRLEGTSEGMSWNQILGQGLGGEGGLGAIDDLAGDDSYEIEAGLTYDHQIVVEDGCVDGKGDPCRSAVAHVRWDRPALLNQAVGQAGSYLGGTGLLQDHHGNDEFRAKSVQRLSVTLEDRLTGPEAPPTLEVEAFDPVSLQVQGSPQSAGGPAVLIDETGTDTYSAEGVNEAHAEATSEHAEGAPAVTARTSSRGPFSNSQGASDLSAPLGALLDLGGSGDRIVASSTNPASTAPDPDGAFQPDGSWPYFQGSFGGMLLALGDEPTIVASPSTPVCPTSTGLHGFGSWSECILSGDDAENEHFGDFPVFIHDSRGAAPLARGRAPTLAVTEDTPAEVGEGERLVAGARLLDPSGEPIAGGTIHFDLQAGCWALGFCDLVPDTSSATGLSWANLWVATGVTGADGVARVRLPTTLGDFSRFQPPWRYRVLATFDGGPGMYPRHAGKAVTIEFA